MKKITAAIIDDEKEARALLKSLLAKYEFVEITIATGDMDVALLSILKDPPDLVFLDIHMPTKDGFELVKEIERLRMPTEIVFVTAYNSYAIKAIKVNAFDYLLKPIDPDELEDTIIRYQQKALEYDDTRKLREIIDSVKIPTRIKIDNEHGFFIVNLKDIAWIKCNSKQVTMIFKNGREEHLQATITVIKEKLPQGLFLEVNKSTYLNTAFITHFDRLKRECTLTIDAKKVTFPIDKNKLKGVENAFQKEA